MNPKVKTYRLNTGVHVMAREVPKIGLYPYHYMSLKQAEKAATKHNAKVHWTGGRCFYLIPNEERLEVTA
jgi:hypothetical protein